MEFEWDAEKDAANQAKHGVSLAAAASLDWATVVYEIDQRYDYGELRYRAYVTMQDRLFTCVLTFRGSRIRVISLRKANRREERRYGKA